MRFHVLELSDPVARCRCYKIVILAWKCSRVCSRPRPYGLVSLHWKPVRCCPSTSSVFGAVCACVSVCVHVYPPMQNACTRAHVYMHVLAGSAWNHWVAWGPSTQPLQFSPIAFVIHGLAHKDKGGQAVEITPRFVCSVFSAWFDTTAKAVLWIRRTFKQSCDDQERSLPFPLLPVCEYPGWFYFMEEMLSISIYSHDCICILRTAEVHTCAKVTGLIYFKDKIRVFGTERSAVT